MPKKKSVQPDIPVFPYKPLRDRLIVQPINESEVDGGFTGKMVGGILVPEKHVNSHSMTKRCIVVAVGDGIRCDNGTIVPLDAKVGDIIIMDVRQGFDMKIGEVDYLLISASQAMCIETK